MAEDKQAAERKAIEAVIVRLTAAFAPPYDSTEVTETVREAYRAFEGSKIRDFVPLLVENAARRALADPGYRASRASVMRTLAG